VKDEEKSESGRYWLRLARGPFSDTALEQSKHAQAFGQALLIGLAITWAEVIAAYVLARFIGPFPRPRKPKVGQFRP
jgi:hypothetical protein